MFEEKIECEKLVSRDVLLNNPPEPLAKARLASAMLVRTTNEQNVLIVEIIVFLAAVIIDIDFSLTIPGHSLNSWLLAYF